MSKKKPQALTDWQDSYKKSRTPKPPAHLSEQAKRQFTKIVSKIIFEPQENGGLMISFEKLTTEEAFAIGESGTDDWPFLPKDIQDELVKMQPHRKLGEYLCVISATDPDLVNAINNARESAREKVLLKLFSESYSNAQKSFREDRQRIDKEKHDQWRKWQTEEKAKNPQFSRLTSKHAQATYLRTKHSISDKVGTIERQLKPLPPSKK